MHLHRTLLLCLTLAACVEKEAPVDTAFVKQNLLSAEPTPKLVVKGDFGKVIYLGADVNKEEVAPGEGFLVTHYWKVVEAPGSEWRAFTHVNGTTGKEWMNVDDTRLRKNHGPDRWKPGEIIRDEQKITLKKDWSSPEADVYVGLYRKGGHSEKDRMPIVAGPNDGHSRMLVVKVKVKGAKAAPPPLPPPPPPLAVRKATGPITIDGKATESDWATAAATGMWADVAGSKKVPGDASAQLLWDDQNLYVLGQIHDVNISTPYKKADEDLWKADTVEMFIDADGNRQGYVELHVNPANAQFDAFIPTTRPNIDKAFSAKLRSAVVLDGTLNSAKDVDKGWTFEVAIPLAAVKGSDAAMAVTLPPKPGDRWNLNFVRVEKGADFGPDELAASSWAEITLADFHAVDKLRTIVFADDKGAVPPVMAPPTAPEKIIPPADVKLIRPPIHKPIAPLPVPPPPQP